MPAKFLTPPQIAKLYGVHPDRVRGWIRSGQLMALDVGDKGRRRFRVRPEDLEIFERARLVVAPEERRHPRRKHTLGAVEEFV